MTRPEEDVVLRLERALHAGLDDAPVDVGRLAARTRTGVRRAAVRRAVATAAAAVAVVAVPVAVATGPFNGALGAPASEGATPSPSVSAPQDPSPTATATGTTPSPTAPPTTPSTPSPTSSQPEPDVVAPSESDPDLPTTARVVPWQEAADSKDYNLVAYRVPDEVFPTAADLPRPMEQMYVSGDYGGIPQVQGQTCNRPQVFPRPVAASAWSWADAQDYEALGIEVNVTGWEPGTGAARFAEIRDDSSEVCAFDRPFEPAPTTGMTAGDERFAARMPGNRMTNGWASVRVGDVIVSVSVYDEDGAKPAVRLARELADLTAARVTASGLADVAAAGGAG